MQARDSSGGPKETDSSRCGIAGVIEVGTLRHARLNLGLGVCVHAVVWWEGIRRFVSSLPRS